MGDISRHCAFTRAVLSKGPLRVVSFGEVIGLGKMRGRQAQYLAAAMDRSEESEFLRVGLSPHAPYTTEGPTLRRVVDRAIEEGEGGGYPVTMHLAELREEAAFLRSAQGRLGEWPVMRNILDDEIPRCADGPLRWAAEWGLLGDGGAAKRVPVVLAHVNYCDDAELAILARSGASVVYCPRTRSYFGHDDGGAGHRYREMLAAGVNVCVGTDSLASNPDLSVLREAQFLWKRDVISAYSAMEMVTRRGAMALGMDAGVLAEGKLADVAIFPATVGQTVDETLADILRGSRMAARCGWGEARRRRRNKDLTRKAKTGRREEDEDFHGEFEKRWSNHPITALLGDSTFQRGRRRLFKIL